ARALYASVAVGCVREVEDEMPIARIMTAVAAVAALASCTPALPTALPRGSAASPDAPEARPARVGLALTEEPPLPGERREGWEGLGDAAPGGHAHHGGHRHGR
ncbi:MAG: hypothetical protein RLP09_49005, partial [Sandaracinaceae bacterium]